MLSIRLARFGKKKQPSYRIVVCQKHKDPFGDYIENIGHINYFGGVKNITLDAEKAKHWISVGAQPTDTIHNLFIEQGIIKEKKRRPDGTRKIVETTEEGEKKEEASEKTPTEKPKRDTTVKEKEENKEESQEDKKEETPAE